MKRGTVAVLSGAALLMTGCTSGHHHSETRAADASESVSVESSCGVESETSAQERLPRLDQIGASKAATVTRQVSTTDMTREDCGAREGLEQIAKSQCDLGDFPWGGSPDRRDFRAYTYGIDSLTEATFSVDDEPKFKELIADTVNSEVASAFAEHLLDCGAEVQAENNGEPVRLASDGGVLDVKGSTIVVVLPTGTENVERYVDVATQRAES